VSRGRNRTGPLAGAHCSATSDRTGMRPSRA
jgi:hypothetical protein